LASALIFNWSLYRAVVVMEGLEELQNAGAQKVIDLYSLRVDSARKAIEDDLGKDVFGDGTGNDSKVIVGLRAAVDDGTTVASYGGITRATTGPGAFIKGNVDTTGGVFTMDVLTKRIGA